MNLIRIDRTTVKKNPNAGSYIENVLVGIHVTFETNTEEIPEWLLPMIEGREFIPFGSGFYKGRLDNPDLLSNLEEYALEQVKKGYSFSIVHHREWKQIYSQEPAPEWLYSYESINLDCPACCTVNSVSYLGINQDGNICCGFCDASMDVDFEDLDAVLKELSLC